MQPKLDITQDIQPLTTFRNNSVKMLQQLKKSGRPIVLTVNGKAEATVLSAIEYQRLMDIAADADEREGVRQGDEDIAAGRTRPAEEVFAEMRKQYGLSR
jgi:PHD/YefM family antitoxin component YafN of YafNO toxin-antitoxin module